MNDIPIKILHVTYAMNAGGIESWLMSIYRQLDRDNIQFNFLVNTKEKAFFDNEIKTLGGKVIYGGVLSNPLEMYKTVKRILIKDNYHTVHCHNVENATPVLKAAIDCQIPNRIYQSHNDLNHKLKHLSFVKSTYLKVSNLFSLKYATKLLAVSKSAGDSLFHKNKYQLISLGIDIEKFAHSSDSPLCRKDFGLQDDDFVIGHVGRFDIQKNHSFFIEIAKELIKINPKTKFLLIGKGKLEKEIKEKIEYEKLEEYFIFTGIRDDVPILMSKIMNIFLFPSLFEGLGLVLVEAQASGLPIICSDIIPNEAIVNDTLVQKISLSKSSEDWTRGLFEHYKKNKYYNKQQAYKKVENSSFNLNNTIQVLEKIWQEKK